MENGTLPVWFRAVVAVLMLAVWCGLLVFDAITSTYEVPIILNIIFGAVTFAIFPEMDRAIKAIGSLIRGGKNGPTS